MIDTKEDVTPETLELTAKDLFYLGRKYEARTVRWAAQRIKELENKLNTNSQNFQIECQIEEIKLLRAKLDIAHNWVLNNADHSESYNQFVKALQQEGGK